MTDLLVYTPPVHRHLARRAAELLPDDVRLDGPRRNAWLRPEATAVGAVATRALFFTPAGEASEPDNTGQWRELYVQILARCEWALWEETEELMRRLYDALHTSGGFTVDGVRYEDVVAFDAPAYLEPPRNEPHRFVLNFAVWYLG